MLQEEDITTAYNESYVSFRLLDSRNTQIDYNVSIRLYGEVYGLHCMALNLSGWVILQCKDEYKDVLFGLFHISSTTGAYFPLSYNSSESNIKKRMAEMHHKLI